MAEKIDKSGFDYYLDLLQESRDETLKEAPRRIFHLLQVHGGQMQLYELVSESLPKDAGEGEVDYIVETIKSLQEAELIIVETLPGNEENNVKSSQSMVVRVTETGRKVLYSGFAS